MNILRVFYVFWVLVVAVVPTTLMAAEQTVATPSVQGDVHQAMDALQQLLSAYAGGKQEQVEALVEPQMIGYSRVVDAVRDAGLTQKQMRLSLLDTRTQISDGVVIVQTRWEKRFLSSSGRVAGRKGGACTFVMRPDASVWRLSALNGDNPFSAD